MCSHSYSSSSSSRSRPRGMGLAADLSMYTIAIPQIRPSRMKRLTMMQVGTTWAARLGSSRAGRGAAAISYRACEMRSVRQAKSLPGLSRPPGFRQGPGEDHSTKTGSEQAGTVCASRAWPCQVCIFAGNRANILRCAMCNAVRGTSWGILSERGC